MKMLVKVLGGSTAFGLNTPESDVDYRGVFVNTEPAKILGLEKLDHVQKQETDDIVYYEVRKFFELLRNGNTGALEILFTDEQLESTPEFDEIRANRLKFIDTDKMFKCLLGYMQGERRLANGERTGVLGGKRKAQLEKYGYSPKNFTQLLRLAHCGVVLFQDGYFPVNLKKDNKVVWATLMDIKTHPENHTKEELNSLTDQCEVALKNAYETRKFNYTFDADLANELMRKIYLPYLMKVKKKRAGI
jgi:predicted nucleotidyltransferase